MLIKRFEELIECRDLNHNFYYVEKYRGFVPGTDKLKRIEEDKAYFYSTNVQFPTYYIRKGRFVFDEPIYEDSNDLILCTEVNEIEICLAFLKF